MIWAIKTGRLLRSIAGPIGISISGIGVVILGLMMLLIVAEVLYRFLFGRSIQGLIEMAQFMMIGLAFAGMAYTAMKKKHLTVDLVAAHLPDRARSFLDALTGVFGLVVVFVMAWQAGNMVRPMWLSGETTAVLLLPMYPMFVVVAIGAFVFFLVLLADLFDTLSDRGEAPRDARLRLVWVCLGMAALAAALLWLWHAPRGVSGGTVGVVGLLLLFILVFSRMPLGLAMAFIGFIGFSYFRQWDAGFGLMGIVPLRITESYLLCAVPLFMLMGQFGAISGMSQELYAALRKWLGSLPGGLAISTVAGCAGFSAITSSSVVAALTMSALAYPEMKRYGYSPALSTGSLAAGGTLGILIPPSMGFILYGILTEQSIGKLFLAGFIPGIILAGLFVLTIYLFCRRYPHLGPPGPSTNYREKLAALRGTWEPLVLFAVVMGGLYGGVFTATEAGAIGGCGALVMALYKRKLNRKSTYESFREAGQMTSMIFVLMIGAYIFNYFLALTRLPFEMVNILTGLQIHRFVILFAILFIYIFLGCVMDVFAVMILTLPLVYPLIATLGFDPIWFGVIMVILPEMGLITPPIGMNVFFIAAATKDVPMSSVFLGSALFLPAFVICLVILILFPKLALFLPNLI